MLVLRLEQIERQYESERTTTLDTLTVMHREALHAAVLEVRTVAPPDSHAVMNT